MPPKRQKRIKNGRGILRVLSAHFAVTQKKFFHIMKAGDKKRPAFWRSLSLRKAIAAALNFSPRGSFINKYLKDVIL
jgi:hypothetical protein